MRLSVKGIFRLLTFIGKVVGIILVLDVIGGSILQLIFWRQWNLLALLYSLPLIFMFEGGVIAFVGCLLYLGFSEYGVMRQGAINPQIARDTLRGWNERRMSQRRWGTMMMVVGLLLFFIGFFLIDLISA